MLIVLYTPDHNVSETRTALEATKQKFETAQKEVESLRTSVDRLETEKREMVGVVEKKEEEIEKLNGTVIYFFPRYSSV
jgi:chromosome segregation ATPase